MEKQKCKVFVFLTDEEYSELKEKAARAGLTIKEFVRTAVMGKEIREAPGADVPELIREVRRVGIGIGQLLRTAGGGGTTEASDLRKTLEEIRAVEKTIVSAYGY